MVTQNNERIGCQFEGLSTDSKPADAPINSLFYELDSGDVYYWDGSAWAKVGG